MGPLGACVKKYRDTWAHIASNFCFFIFYFGASSEVHLYDYGMGCILLLQTNSFPLSVKSRVNV